MWVDADCDYMDKISSGKGAPKEVARESLIAISYNLPENNLPSKLSSPNNNSVEKTDSDGADKFRSELISISDNQFPDAQPSCLAPSQLKR